MPNTTNTALSRISTINRFSEQLVYAKVEEIRWERIHLYLKVRLSFAPGFEPDTGLDFYAVNGLNDPKILFDQDVLEKDLVELHTNITNPGNKACLPMGTYRIVVCQGNEELCRLMADPRIVPDIDAQSRTFLYGKNRRFVYSTTFFVDEGEDDLPLTFYTMPSKATNTRFPQLKISRLFKLYSSPERYYKKHFRDIMRLWYKIARKLYGGKKSTGTVLFMSEQNATLNSNQMAVINRMQERGLDQQFTILTSARRAASKKYRKKSWLGVIKKMAQAEYIFLDDHVPMLDWLKLDPETTVIQLWHAGAGFKSSGYSRWGHIGCPAPANCHRQYDYGIAGSRTIAHFFSEVFGINTDRILPTGMPRMDEYLNPDYKAAKTQELYDMYPMCQGRKVLLFAPTYRGKNRAQAYYPYELIDFHRLYDFCQRENWVVLFKMHPWVADPVPVAEEHADRFVDVGQYPNINDLFYFTDLLITDYSSNIFEYSLMNRPMLFFAFDKIQYSFSRGFHRDYDESAPGKVCETFDDLMTALETGDFEFEKVQVYVKNQFDYIDTGASDRVIDWFLLDQMPEDLRKAIDDHDQRFAEMKRLKFTPKNYLAEELADEEANGEDASGDEGISEEAAETEKGSEEKE